ncbi:lysostaphin resistance A-like protein [Promineifilum sp.]|uniref:CPBP family intramembrane glutamic endopeptidase n=1 Tax=Promineifilum sp. TaxID=2664178 RepID=UPI0035B2DD8A
MTLLLVSLPILLIMGVANVVAARGGAGARLAFNLLLFLANALLAAGGLALLLLPAESLNLAGAGLPGLGQGRSGVILLGMGLWGMAASLKPTRRALARLLPALEPESAVHTLALAMIGYLAGNAALSSAPGALEALVDSGLEASLVDVLTQQLMFVLAAFIGVGLFTRRDSVALNERLGLRRPTARQLWTGVRWMLFFVFLQGCIGATWTLLDPAQAEQLGGLNEALLGDFDTVWEWFLLAAAAGLGEELLFRGALQPVFGIVFTSLIFAVSHVQYGLSPATLTVFLLSVVLGIIRKRSNTTVAILVHAGYNFILGLLSLLAVSLS